jgi:hypothetical protein
MRTLVMLGAVAAGLGAPAALIVATGLMVAGCGGGEGGGASQSTTGPTVEVQCLVAGTSLELARVPRVGETFVDPRSNRAGRVVRSMELRLGSGRRLTTLHLVEESGDGGGGATSGGPNFNIDIDCGPRNSNNPVTTSPA